MFLLLAPYFPVLFLFYVGGCDEDVIEGAPALIDRFFNDLDRRGCTDYRVRSGMPLSSGYK